MTPELKYEFSAYMDNPGNNIQLIPSETMDEVYSKYRMPELVTISGSVDNRFKDS